MLESDIQEALLQAIIDVAGSAEPDADGNVSEDVQYAIDQLAAAADDPEALRALLDEGDEEGDDDPARLSLLDDDSDRSATESADDTVDALIDRGAAGAIAISDEIRQRVRALIAKKKTSSGPNY